MYMSSTGLLPTRVADPFKKGMGTHVRGVSIFILHFELRLMRVFYAFDLLSLNGEDLRALPLLERKARLRKLIRRGRSRRLYVDHVEREGCELFKRICELDLEG